jgi:hypothetical protein
MWTRMMAENGRIGGSETPPRDLSRPPRKTAHIRWTAAAAIAVLALSVGPAAGQALRLPLDYPAVPPEQAADVILVLRPHVTLPAHIPAPSDRIVQGDIVRLEKGVLPQTIVHTKNTIGSPLQAGVPMKLFLKAFRDGHAHYIIAARPELGVQP